MSTMSNGRVLWRRAACTVVTSTTAPARLQVSSTSASLSAIVGAVHHHDVANAGTGQRHGNTLPGFTGAEHQHALGRQFTEQVGGHLHCGMAHRGGGATDGGFGASPLASFECVAEEQVECGLRATFTLCCFPCAAHLPDDFGFTEHG